MRKDYPKFRPHGSPYHLDDVPEDDELDKFEKKYPHLSDFLKDNARKNERSKVVK